MKPSAVARHVSRPLGRVPLPFNPWRRPSDDELRWREIQVRGHRTAYAGGGDGLPVLFLHGWGVGHRSYQPALRPLTERGCRVFAPTLPGFGGTPELADGRTIEGYAAWANDFLDAVGVEEPVLVVGHSFGGGVATRLAYDFPERVRYLVLINSVGGSTWEAGPNGARPLADRRLWEWAFHFAREFSSREGLGILRASAEDLTLNLLTNPVALWQIGQLARRADLTAELATLGERNLSVLLLSSDHDAVIPLESFGALCAAIGADGRVVTGRHSWVLAEPTTLSEVLHNVLEVQAGERDTSARLASTAEVARLLALTSVPRRTVNRLLAAAPPLWMMNERPAVLAADLSLCHPPLAEGEVRAVARPIEGSASWRLTVVAPDRPGLLADTAAVLAAERVSVRAASAATWEGIALHALTFHANVKFDAARWEELGHRLQAMEDAPPKIRFSPAGRAKVTVDEQAGGLAVVKVQAPDQLGLLWAISQWMADHGVSIESASVSTDGARASDLFVVDGPFDPDDLAAHLTRSGPVIHHPKRLAGRVLSGRLPGF